MEKYKNHMKYLNYNDQAKDDKDSISCLDCHVFFELGWIVLFSRKSI
jgi:hypothetical protein